MKVMSTMGSAPTAKREPGLQMCPPVLKHTYTDAEHVLREFVELGFRACEGDLRAMAALDAALSIVVQRSEVHFFAVEIEAASEYSGLTADVIYRHIDRCRDLLLTNLEALIERLRAAAEGTAVAESFVLTGVVMLQDWFTHGRFLCALSSASASGAPDMSTAPN